MEHTPTKILRLPEVMKRTGLSRSSIYAYMADNLFPNSVNIGKRSVGWRESDIEAWIAKRVKIQ